MRLGAFLLAAGIAALAAAAPAQAAKYNVTGTAAPGTCDGLTCNGVRAALAAAAASKGVDDEIDLKKTTYTIANTLQIADGDGVTIVGAGARDTIVSGGKKARVVNVLSGTVILQHLTVTGGAVTDVNGAGILNAATLGLDHVRVTDNEAFNGGAGGGIANTGLLVIAYSLIDNNRSAGDAGGILNFGGTAPATLSVRDSTISGNSAVTRTGIGGLSTRGNAENSVTLQRVSVADNIGGSIGAGGLGVFAGGGTVGARATIVARNSLATGAPSNCAGTVRDDGFNLESGTDCGFKDQNAN